jgi:hypothetical protein
VRILGVDFTSAPRPAKPITVAVGALVDDALVVERVDRIDDFEGFERMLRMPGPWVGGFDFPFGLPRELVVALGWPLTWAALVRHYAKLDRGTVATAFDAFRAARAAGSKYAHRSGDAASGAHSPMKLVNPPVAWMLHAGAPRLLEAGVHLPTLHEGDRTRVALEAYPGLAMRRIAAQSGHRRAPSYKSDARAGRTSARREARILLLDAIVRGDYARGVPVSMPRSLANATIDDGSGDTLDSIAAAVQAAWGAQRAVANYGMPECVDQIEGWIVTA